MGGDGRTNITRVAKCVEDDVNSHERRRATFK